MNSQCSASTMLSEAPSNKLKITLPIIECSDNEHVLVIYDTLFMFWLFMTL